jgi:hypothetical protein
MMSAALLLAVLTACAPGTIPPLSPSLSPVLSPSPAPVGPVEPEEGWWRAEFDVPNGQELAIGVWTPETRDYADWTFYYVDDSGERTPIQSIPVQEEFITLEVYASTNAKTPAPCIIVLLVDGIPAKFVPPGEAEPVFMHPFPVGEEGVTFCIACAPELSSRDGRLDVGIFSYPMSMRGSTMYENKHLYNQARTVPVKSNPHPVSPLPESVLEYLKTFEKGAYSTGWDVRPDGAGLDYLFAQDMKTLDLTKEGGAVVFYAYATLPGQYRTAFFLDYQPFAVHNGECFVDWSIGEGEMLELPLSFEGVEHPSVFTAATVYMDDCGLKYPIQSWVNTRLLILP